MPRRDDSEDEEFEVEEEEDQEQEQRKGQKRKSAYIDDAAEDDDEDEDEDEEEYRRRLKKSRFIDDIAAVDEEEDEEEDEDEAEDLIDDAGEEIPPDEDLPRLYRRDAEMRKRDEMSAEELEEYIKQRFEQRTYDVGDREDADAGVVAQQGLLPTHEDPKLWLVEAKAGQEREAVICLLQKAVDMASKGTPLGIKSAFTQDHLKGYLYIEAYKEAHVKEAIRGLRVIRASKGAKLVPLKEMVDAITVNMRAKASIEPGSWVRMRAGTYKHDLAKVVDVDDSTGRATIKLVPRLDYAAMAQRKEQPVRGFPKQPAIKPPAKAFSVQDAKEHRLVVEQRRNHEGDYEYMLNGMRFVDGYMVRQVATKTLILEEAMPPLDELQRFNQVGQAHKQDDHLGNAELASLINSISTEEEARGSQPVVQYAKGDKVIVVEGDLKSLMGKVHHLAEDGKVEVMPQMEGLTEVLTFDAAQLQKFFQSGDHVKVIHGKHEGVTGMVVRVEDGTCYVFADNTREEIRVFSRDLTESAEIGMTGLDTFGQYELHDLVVLDQQTAGIIVAVDKDTCRVLTNQGTPEKPDIRLCRLPDIKRKMITRKAVTQDKWMNPVNVGDIVNVEEGILKGKSATVKHIMRGSLFLQTREIPEHGGFVCVRARICRVRGGKAAPIGSASRGMGAMLKSPAPYRAMQMGSGGAPVLSSPSRIGSSPGFGIGSGGFGGRAAGGLSGGGGGGGGFSGRTTARASDSLVGKMINIAKGPFRGYRGRVVSATDTHVRMELEAQYKTVTVKRDQLRGEDGLTSGPSDSRQQYGAPHATPNPYGSRTPMHTGSATPGHAWGSATPSHPSMTPSYGSQTPLRDSAWNPVAQTPLHPSMDPGSAATPMDAPIPGAYGGSSYAPYGNAYTPAETPAQTPGLDIGGTPGTPGFGHVRTPYADGATPVDHTPTYSPSMGPTPGTVATPELGGTPGTPGLDGMSPGMDHGGDHGQDWTHWDSLAVQLPTGECGVVRNMAPDGRCQVALGSLDAEGNLSVPPDAQLVPQNGSDLVLMQPRSKNTIKIVRGELRGQTGQLIGVDNTDGIVKLDHNLDIKILDMSTLGRLIAA
ncbi:hypothetical protein WJX72_009461 [[Myrmecia] bisecta]|uniref:Transcription elongation factor SPT5 n=1 Tax=[Myrmecia] bisecta TaxID=41462 RepID=A0AAW1PTF4_9CHLO